MIESQFLKKSWTSILLDSQMMVTEITHSDDRLFWGKPLTVGTKLTDSLSGDQDTWQLLQQILDAVQLAKDEKRTVYLEYISTEAEDIFPVMAFAEYCGEDVVCLHATATRTADVQRCRKNFGILQNIKDSTESILLLEKYETLYNQMVAVINSLPVGIEVYREDGQLLFLNDTDYHIFGVDKKSFDIDKVNIQDNPNLPLEVKEGVKKGIRTHTTLPYSFGVVRDTDFFTTSQEGTILIECNGQPVADATGQFRNYVFIVEDVTESERRNEELRQSKRKIELAMQDADIMLWDFDVSKQLFFCDNEPLNGFNRNQPITIDEYRSIIHPDDKPRLLEVLKHVFAGEDFSFKFDARVFSPGHNDWQYCTLNGTPYEKTDDGKVLKYIGTRKNNTEFQKKKLLQDNILNSLPVSIHIKDVNDNFRYVFCNDESKKLFGTSEDKTTYDVMDADKVTRLEKTDREVFITGKPYFGLEHIELKDGRTYDILVRKKIIYDEGKRLLLSVRWDQSLQNDLERRAKILNITMEAMNAYTWFYEPERDRVSFGEGSDKIGRDATQYDSLEKFLSFIHPEDRQLFDDSIKSVIRHEKEEWNVEYRADLNEDGIYEWWQTRGMIETTFRDEIPYTYMFGMTINIEEHKQTELTLLSNREELNRLIRQNEMVLNNINSGLAYVTSDYRVQWENISTCLNIPGGIYRKGEVCYESSFNRTSPCEKCVMHRALSSRQVEHMKYTIGDRIAEIYATPVFKEDGSNDGVVIRIDDVTDREKMIGDLKQAVQSDKLKSAFLANMSHEIRTPLNAIVGFSELLMSATDEEDKEEYIRIINNNNELLLKLINDILDLSKIEAGAIELKYEEFDLSTYFDGLAVSMKQRIINPEVRLVATNPFQSCMVKLDKNRVAQVLSNYVTNAIKYTREGTIEMGYEQVEQGIRFYVKDTGIGIPDKKKHKVFFRFEKLDEFAQGTGLGLSICKAIAESMGGSVGFESKQEEGSLFWAILPCEINAKLNLRVTTDLELPLKMSDATHLPFYNTTGFVCRKTILVAEDILSNCLLVLAILKKDFDLLYASNGQEAVDIVKTKQVDLVLMDMKMPVMGGLAATEEIRKIDSKLPIIALTAHAFDADQQAALNAGCNEYLVKPINKERLMAALWKYCVPDQDH